MLLAGVLMAGAGCRDVITPPGPEDSAAPVTVGPITVLDFDGLPLGEVSVRLDEAAESPLGGFFGEDWRGSTDESGVIYPPVPPGLYVIEVNALTRGLANYDLLPVELDSRPSLIDPGPLMHTGRVELPEGLDIDGLRIRLATRVAVGSGTRVFESETQVAEDGTFLTVLPCPARYRARLDAVGLWYVPPDSLDLAPSLESTIPMDMFRQELRFTLGGNVPPRAAVWLQTTSASDRGQFSGRVTVQDGLAQVWAIPGPGSLNVDGDDSMPVMRRSIHHEFAPGSTSELELGEHEVVFNFVAGATEPVYGARMEIERTGTGDGDLFTGLEPGFKLFLGSGQFLAEVTAFGELGSYRIFTITSDTTLTIQLDPID